MAKSNKNLYIGIGIVVAVVAIVVGVVVGLNAGKGDKGADNGNTSQTTGGLTASDLKSVDVEVEYGDYDKMSSLSKDIQNGYATGKVVKVDGVVSHPMSSYSVVQANADGSQKIGTQFIIESDDASVYPKDGDRIVITGKVVENSPMYFVIKTSPEFVVVE